MPINESENKWIESASSQTHVSLNELTMLEETENIEITAPMQSRSSESPVKAADEQTRPHFYELKIRVRKYDFL